MREFIKNLDNKSSFRRIDLYGDGFLEANGAFIIDRYNR